MCQKDSDIYLKEPEPEISIPPVVAREEHHVSWPLSFLRGALKQLTLIVKPSVDNWEGLLFWNIFSLMSRVETISTQSPKTKSIYENYLCTSNTQGVLHFIPLNGAPTLRWDLTKSAQSVNRFSRAGARIKRKLDNNVAWPQPVLRVQQVCFFPSMLVYHFNYRQVIRSVLG